MLYDSARAAQHNISPSFSELISRWNLQADISAYRRSDFFLFSTRIALLPLRLLCNFHWNTQYRSSDMAVFLTLINAHFCPSEPCYTNPFCFRFFFTMSEVLRMCNWSNLSEILNFARAFCRFPKFSGCFTKILGGL